MLRHSGFYKKSNLKITDNWTPYGLSWTSDDGHTKINHSLRTWWNRVYTGTEGKIIPVAVFTFKNKIQRPPIRELLKMKHECSEEKRIEIYKELGIIEDDDIIVGNYDNGNWFTYHRDNDHAKSHRFNMNKLNRTENGYEFMGVQFTK